MTSDRPAAYLVSLVNELRAFPCETEWLEFKVNDAEPHAIGEYISALANAAALVGKAFAYMVWGVQNDHAVVGTSFDPAAARVGNEALENWLLRLLEPKEERLRRLPAAQRGGRGRPDRDRGSRGGHEGAELLAVLGRSGPAAGGECLMAARQIGDATPEIGDN